MIRKLLVIVLIGVMCLLGAVPILAWDQYNSLEEYEQATGKKIEEFSQAPMLRVKVAAGELPPVAERLPEEPVVIEPWEEIGQYGGTLYYHVPGSGQSIGSGLAFLTIQNMVRFGVSPYMTTIIPNITKGWEFSEDGKSITFYLRKGMKWSDGAPFTADDCLFWYEDVISNDELTPTKPSWMIQAGELMTVEKIDDYTIRMSSSTRLSARFLNDMLYYGDVLVERPKHYMKQFHPRYTAAEELAEIVKKEGFDYWFQLFAEKGKRYQGAPTTNPDLPTLGAYVLKEIGLQNWLYERNPYYWKVDTAGNQLPYIDECLISVVANMEMLNAKIVTGENDFHSWLASMGDYTLYKENEEVGDYRTLLYMVGTASKVTYFFNQTIEDPILRKIFRDVRFRRAMSLAIDREEVAEACFLGYAVPVQVTNNPGSAWYEPEFAEAYAQYDPNESNRLLDEIGLSWDKNHEYRLKSDGKRLTVIMEFYDASAEFVMVNELVREQWKKVGFDLVLKGVSGTIGAARNRANQIQLSQMASAGSDYHMFSSYSSSFVPVMHAWIYGFGPLWVDWYLSKGEKGEEPPEEVKKNMERWERAKDTMDDAERIRLGKEILASQAENLWTIGTVGYPAHVALVSNRLRNVPGTTVYPSEFSSTVLEYGETFFFEQK